MKMLCTNDKGFTMVEVLVAFVSLAIGMAAVWGLHISSLRVDLKNTRQTSALNNASQVLETLRNPKDSTFFKKIKDYGDDGEDGKCKSTEPCWENLRFPLPPDNHTTYEITVVDNNSGSGVGYIPKWRIDLTFKAIWKERIRDRTGSTKTVDRNIELYTYVVDPDN